MRVLLVLFETNRHTENWPIWVTRRMSEVIRQKKEWMKGVYGWADTMNHSKTSHTPMKPRDGCFSIGEESPYLPVRSEFRGHDEPGEKISNPDETGILLPLMTAS